MYISGNIITGDGKYTELNIPFFQNNDKRTQLQFRGQFIIGYHHQIIVIGIR